MGTRGGGVLVVGSGGREHALASKLAESAHVGRVIVAPGNGGTRRMASGAGDAEINDVNVAVGDIDGLIALAAREQVLLTVIGPEVPLADGIVDAFAAASLPCFGPRREAARLEASKAFSKAFMERHGIPTARSATFTDHGEALAHLAELPYDVVVKASGLAAGKGVIVTSSKEEAAAALARIMLDRAFGSAGDEVVIEERLVGPEASMLAFCDGHRVALMPAAQDHKAVFDGDRGPNTGGMGAYAPAPLIGQAERDLVAREVLQRTVDGMRSDGTPYVGVLYAGLMMTADGPRTLEFNVRFGDPETQVLLPLLASDLLDVMLACVEGRLEPDSVRWHDGAAATVVAASGGYPGGYEKGFPIHGLERADEMAGVDVVHAGTQRDDAGRFVTSGGRVLSVTGSGADLATALARAYDGMDLIEFEGMHVRNDIGWRAVGGLHPRSGGGR